MKKKREIFDARHFFSQCCAHLLLHCASLFHNSFALHFLVLGQLSMRSLFFLKSIFLSLPQQHIQTIAAMSTSSTSLTSCLQVKFLSETATMPTRGSPQAAGFDLASAEKTVVPAGGRAVVKTDLSIACPEGTYARIAPRR